MLSIRLVRFGKKHAPTFRVVAQEKRRAPSSKYVEKLGHYIPHQKPKVLELNAERILYWISKGAQPTDTVYNLLVQNGIIKGEKRCATTITKKRAEKIEVKVKEKKEKEKAKKEAEKTKTEVEAPKTEETPAEKKAEAPKTEETPAEKKAE